MKSKDQQLLEEAYQTILEEYDSSQFDPRLNKADRQANAPVAKEEPTSLPSRGNHRDPETPDYTKATGRYAIEGPHPEKAGSVGYWHPETEEFLYGKYQVDGRSSHITKDLEQAKKTKDALSAKYSDLAADWKKKNYGAGIQNLENYNPFHVVQFYKRG